MDKTSFFLQVAKDLSIIPYTDETKTQFFSRISYSAIGMWARMLAATSDSSDDLSGNISKNVFHRKLSAIIARYSNMDEGVSSFFCLTEDASAENAIRDVLLRSGDLVEIGFPARLAISPTKKMSINDANISVLIGTIFDYKSNCISSGLSVLLASDNTGKMPDYSSYFSKKFYQNAESVVLGYVKKAKWELVENLADYEIFVPNRNGVISSCWEQLKSTSDDFYSVARLPLSYGGFDYRLIKQSSNKKYISRLPDYAQLDFIRDTQRLLYGMKSLSGKERS